MNCTESMNNPSWRHHVCGPHSVRGRNSDNTLLRKVLSWEPQISLEAGLGVTYRWIEKQVAAQLSVQAERQVG